MTTLGSAEAYYVRVHYQEGTRPYMDLSNIIECRWSRVLDDHSEAFVSIALAGLVQSDWDQLGRLDAWGHELSIYRDRDLVWQGPVYEVVYTQDRVEISARDVIAYLDRRLNYTAFDYSPTGSGAQDVGFVFDALIQNGLSPYDPLLLPHFTWELIGQTTERKAAALEVVIGDELRDLSRIGLDFTTMGRAIVATKEKLASEYTGTPLVLTEEHFAGELRIQVVGAETTTWVTVLGDGVSSSTGIPVDWFYGQIHRLERAERVLDSSSASAIADSIRAETHPTPVYVVVPTDGLLTYDAPITVEQLVCGSRIDIYTQSFCRNVAMAAKLTRVTGHWTATEGERIGVSVRPLPTA